MPFSGIHAVDSDPDHHLFRQYQLIWCVQEQQHLAYQLASRPTSPGKTQHSRAINWVNDKLLEQAHTRLAPGDLYYPVDEEASRQGRWQQQAREALEECGHAYFLLPPGGDVVGADDVTSMDGDDDRGVTQSSSSPVFPSFNSNANGSRPIAYESKKGGFPAMPSDVAHPRAGGKRTQTEHRRPSTSEAASRRAAARSNRKAAAALVATRELLEEQSHGLHMEVKRAMRVATKTLREGDRVESRWRRPTRLDKPRVDPGGWHPGRVVQSHKDGGRVDVVFEDGDEERLSGIPTKYVRRAPSPTSLKRSLVSTSGKENDAMAAVVGISNDDNDPSSSTPTPMTVEQLSSASRRELAHIVCAAKSLRCTWEDPVPIDQEMARLRMLGEEKMRGRPEWEGSFPVVNFQATKRLPFGAGGMAGVRAARAGRAAAASTALQDCRRGRQKVRARSRKSSSRSVAVPKGATAQPNPGWGRHGNPQRDGAYPVGQETPTTVRRRSTTTTATALGEKTPRAPSLAPAGLLTAQSRLVAAAVAYDRCVAGARDCLDRGSTTFRQARTYSEQQKAFEESTAVLGPSQPARAGYTDWRGRPVTGLQNATLNVVEAMDAWAAEWRAAREDITGVGEKNNGDMGQEQVAKDGAVAPVPIAAPPFLWEGSPLVSTIIGHSANLLGGTPELGKWYGPGFPIQRNPFFLAHPLDDRPVTPRNALVRAWVNGEVSCGMVCGWTPGGEWPSGVKPCGAASNIGYFGFGV